MAPPRSRIGAITANERASVRARSPIGPTKDDTAVNRESAYEILRGAVGTAGATRCNGATGATGGGRMTPAPTARWEHRRRSNQFLWGTKRRQGMVETMAKQTARTVGSQLGRQILLRSPSEGFSVRSGPDDADSGVWRLAVVGDHSGHAAPPAIYPEMARHLRNLPDQGAGYPVRVIEDCLNGWCTVWDDPFKPGRNGLAGIEQRIEVNSPLSLMILMLGTNDLSVRKPAQCLALGSGRRIHCPGYSPRADRAGYARAHDPDRRSSAEREAPAGTHGR